MIPDDIALLTNLLVQTGLPAAISTQQLTGRGFDSTVYRVTLADGQQVMLRRWREPRPPEHLRAQFLAEWDIPSPAFLAGNEQASLHAFVPGTLLGDLIESDRCTDDHWRAVGRAYRWIHAVIFPRGLVGEVRPDRIILKPVDPVARLHEQLAEAVPGLRARLPETECHLPPLHALINQAAQPLRNAQTALGHGDINMWNIIVDGDEATLIDWDYPRIGDPAMEVALLDKHAALFNGRGVPESFFAGYGHAPTEPNTSIHRIVQTLAWAASDNWTEFATMPPGLSTRADQWLQSLLAYVARLPEHIERLAVLIERR